MSTTRWAPNLPEDWGVATLRWVAEIFAGGTPDKSNLDFWTAGTIPWLNSGSVNDWSISKPSALITEDAYASSSAKWIPPKSVVIALAGQGKTKGLAARIEFECTCNQSMAAIVPGPKLDYRFLHYWLISNYQNIRNMAGGDKRDGLNLVHIGSIDIPLPLRHVQRAIADFLDRETSRIDSLILDQERLIDLLIERRRAIISTNTSGAKWRSIQLVRCLTGQVDYRGATPTKQDWGVQLITAKNVKKGWIDYDSSKEYIDPKAYFDVMRRGLPEKDDLLFTMEAPLGNVALVDRTNIALAQRIIKWRLNQVMASPRFILYVVLSDKFQFQLQQLSTGSTALGIKASKLSQLRIQLPEMAEQERTVAHIDEQISKVDTLIAETEKFIELSRERRAALITAAVTGQIDVREEVA